MEHSSKKQVFVVDPIMNLVFPARAMRTVVGNMWGSRGPNIPWGRTATVLRVSELAARTACKWRTVTHTHTHTPFNGLFSGTTQVSRYQKGKTNLDLLKQERVSGSGISWVICKSAPCSRQTTTPAPHHSVFYKPDALPAAQPTASKHWRHTWCTVK